MSEINLGAVGGDPVTNAEQAVAISACVNADNIRYFQDRDNAWLMTSEILKSTGKPVPPRPERPLLVRWMWTDHIGLVRTIGPEYACDYPPVSPRITEVGKIDDIVGGEVADKPGHRYNLGLSNQKWTHVSGPPTRIWTLVQEGMFTTYWTELVPPGV